MRKNMRPKNHTNCFDSTFSSSILFVFSSFKTCWNAWSFGLEFFARRFLLFYVNLIATYYQFDVQSILYVNTHTHTWIVCTLLKSIEFSSIKYTRASVCVCSLCWTYLCEVENEDLTKMSRSQCSNANWWIFWVLLFFIHSFNFQ